MNERVLLNERFWLFDKLLREENQRQNLTRDLDAPDYEQRLYLDSLTPLAVPGLVPPDIRAVDVGSGAGFPGVPLAIMRSDIIFTFVDSLGKRCKFLERAVAELGLNATVIHARAEDFGRMAGHRGAYDAAFSRAVAALPVLLEYTIPLLKVSGLLIAHKGPAVVDELPTARRAALMLGARLADPIAAPTPGIESAHVLVTARAIKRCPEQYPRKAGIPAKQPLGG
ncbi:ribosomal RNA small subunit methyltransferase G [Clostridia bacterium]|nr:ribosomal RNA small subunit methyltransferase G [Clostridia bacterium]